MRSEVDDWWATLSAERKASIHRWLTGRRRTETVPVDGEVPMFTDAGDPVDDVSLGGAA